MAALIVRADSMNADQQFPYRTVALIAFGSYLSDKPELNDVDVAVWIEQKPWDKVTFPDPETMERIADSAWNYLRGGQSFDLALVPVREADLVRRLNALLFMDYGVPDG